MILSWKKLYFGRKLLGSRTKESLVLGKKPSFRFFFPRILHGFFMIITAIWEASVWPVLLPCSGSGEKEIWPSGMEHCLWLQWIRFTNLDPTTSGKSIWPSTTSTTTTFKAEWRSLEKRNASWWSWDAYGSNLVYNEKKEEKNGPSVDIMCVLRMLS